MHPVDRKIDLLTFIMHLMENLPNNRGIYVISGHCRTALARMLSSDVSEEDWLILPFTVITMFRLVK